MIDLLARDLVGLRALDMPILGRWPSARMRQLNLHAAVHIPIVFRVCTGDLIVGALDGMAVIPRELISALENELSDLHVIDDRESLDAIDNVAASKGHPRLGSLPTPADRGPE